jgi:hypothetical protein
VQYDIREKLQIARLITTFVGEEYISPACFELEFLNQIDTVFVVEKVMMEQSEKAVTSAW